MENSKVFKKSLVLGLLNIRSMVYKFDKIYELINEGFDFLILTESWHGSSEDISLRLAMPPGYSFIDYIRPHDPHHGGLVVYFRSNFKYSVIELPLLKTFEAIAIKFCIDRVEILLLVVYRPGSAPVSSLFFKELMSVLEHVSVLSTFVFLAGDFNVHVERPNDPHAIYSNCFMAESKMLTSFLVCSSEDVKKIVLYLPSKSCSLDCLSTYIFKRYIDLFLPFSTSLINLCLRVGYFPFAFKHAIVISLLKSQPLIKMLLVIFAQFLI